jgi:hypothetical protein
VRHSGARFGLCNSAGVPTEVKAQRNQVEEGSLAFLSEFGHSRPPWHNKRFLFIPWRHLE